MFLAHAYSRAIDTAQENEARCGAVFSGDTTPVNDIARIIAKTPCALRRTTRNETDRDTAVFFFLPGVLDEIYNRLGKLSGLSRSPSVQ